MTPSSYAWEMPRPSTAYEPMLELRNAIILRAVQDYKYSGNTRELDSFFRSEYFQSLLNMDNTALDVESLIYFLRKERESIRQRRLNKKLGG